MLLKVRSSQQARDERRLGERRSAARVLVVDDSESHRYAVSRALRTEGFDVIEADSCESALALAGRMFPDVVVLDVDLPRAGDLELCRKLRAPSSGLLPILHLSASGASEEARARGIAAGADGYLAHPFDPNELRAAVNALVRLKRGETDRQTEAAAASLLQEALDALADHIALLSPTGEVIAVNRAWAEFAESNGYAFGGNRPRCQLLRGLRGCDRRRRRGCGGGRQRNPPGTGRRDRCLRARVFLQFADRGTLVPDDR